MENKKIIAIDMDDTICLLMKAIQEDHNMKHPEHIVPYEKIIAFDESMFHPDYSKMDFFCTPNTFFNLKVIDEYMVDALEKLNEKYDVIIVTSAFPECVLDKWKWLQKHLPFIPQKNFITASRKDLIHADILIDDAEHNIKAWSATGRPSIVYKHHWNQHLSKYPQTHLLSNWKEIYTKINVLLS